MLPKKLALFKNRGEPISDVHAQHYSIGEKHSKVFSVGIQQFQKSIDKLNVSNNNLTDKCLQNIIQSLGTRIRTLDLSNNQMSKQNCLLLGQITQNQTFNLRDINLQGNKLTDIVVQPFLQYCVEQMNINIVTKLNLSKNLITEKSCKILKDFLIKSRELLELYLSWNRLNHEASLYLTQGLQENTLLKVLDLSYNKLGGNENSIKEWVKVFERDDKMDLIHLDLSYNSFTLKESMTLAEGLANNHTIYGFHFKGNIGSVDCKGFIKQENKNNSANQSDQYLNNPQINGINMFSSTQLYDNCWICYGWVELTFWWKPYISDTIDPENILIHFSFDNYEPHPMERKQNNFFYTKMCPPNQKFNFFYTIGGHHYFTKEKNINYKQVQNPKIIIPYSDIDVDAEVPIMNFMIPQKPQKIFNIHYKTQYSVKPRKLEIINFILPKEIIVVPWSHNNSIFKDYPLEEDLLDKCFEKDWNDSKIDRIIPQTEQEQVKILLRQKYKLLKNMYKYYASISPSGEIWSIGQNVYTEIMINSKIQNQNYGSSSVSYNFVNTNAGSYKKNASLDTINNNPSNSLIRYQLIEILVRNIYDKYVKGNGQINNFIDAWNLALKDGLEDIFNKIEDEEQWREQYYWTQKMEICILKFKNLLERLFFNYAGLKKKQISKNKFMSIDDFRAFVFESQILGDSLADRDINMGYNLAMMLQIDEISSSRYIQMNKLEFYEALARFADIICPMPYGTHPDDEKFWPLEQRVNLNVYIKLEALLASIHFKQDKYYQEDNRIHEYSIFSQEIEEFKTGIVQTVNIRKNVQNKLKANLRRKSKLGNMLNQKQGLGKLVSMFGAKIIKDDKPSVQTLSSNVTQINQDQQSKNSESGIDNSSSDDQYSDSIDLYEDEKQDNVQNM